MRDANTVLANDPTFRTRMGQWTYIHLAYTDQGLPSSFPSMINFMIMQQNIQITSTNLNGLFINRFSIPITTYALLAKIRVYSKYLINSYGFVFNNFASFPTPTGGTYFDIGSDQYNCNVPANMVSGYPGAAVSVCVRDFDNMFNAASLITTGQYKYFNRIWYNSSTVINCASSGGYYTCSTACANNTGAFNHIDCSCDMSNGNTSMIFKNSGKNMCKSKYYLNNFRI